MTIRSTCWRRQRREYHWTPSSWTSHITWSLSDTPKRWRRARPSPVPEGNASQLIEYWEFKSLVVKLVDCRPTSIICIQRPPESVSSFDCISTDTSDQLNMLLDTRIVVDTDDLDYRAPDVFARYATLQHATDLTLVNRNILDLMLSHKDRKTTGRSRSWQCSQSASHAITCWPDDASRIDSLRITLTTVQRRYEILLSRHPAVEAVWPYGTEWRWWIRWPDRHWGQTDAYLT